MTEEDAIWHWLTSTGLYFKHPDLKPRQIMDRYGLKAVHIDGRWQIWRKRRRRQETAKGQGDV